jgi:hypothetical protein
MTHVACILFPLNRHRKGPQESPVLHGIINSVLGEEAEMEFSIRGKSGEQVSVEGEEKAGLA